MRMQDTIIQLKALGQMPDSLTGNPAGELVSKYDELLIKVKTPLTEEEVEALRKAVNFGLGELEEDETDKLN